MNNLVLEFMEKHGLERTRETYLEIAYFGTPPEVLDAEQEADLPAEFRLGYPGDWKEFD